MSPEDEIKSQPITSLTSLEANVLRRRWRSLMGRPAPADLPRPLMMRILSWKEQTLISGELGAKARAYLAKNLEKPQADPVIQAQAYPSRIKPGTIFTKEYAGVLHRVSVVDKGFSWNGRTFTSLSAVARAITGTHWNGPRFFGLTQVRTKASKSALTRSDRESRT